MKTSSIPGNVLLVEDNLADRMLLSEAINKVDPQVKIKCLENGEQSIHYFSSEEKTEPVNGPQWPKIVILDINLPKIGGIEVLKYLKSHETTRHIPVVVLSSSELNQEREEALAAGADEVMIKPTDFNLLIQYAENIVRKYCR